MKKKPNAQLMILVTFLSVVIVLTGCKKDDDTTDDTIKTYAPTSISDTSTFVGPTWATVNGSIIANNLTTVVWFEYDTIITYKHILAAIPDTATGSNTTKVSVDLNGLTPNTTYHYRVKSTNSLGTTYGNDKKFTTLSPFVKDIVFNPDLTYGQVSDIDGNVYKTIQIGEQTWMAENLITTRFNDGSDIPWIIANASWALASAPAYCWYNNSIVNFGPLYNWYSVSTGKLCPTGWHVPTDAEWTTLTTWSGGDVIAGGKLKETGTTHWLSPNTGATNSSGFTAEPGGYRYYSGTFNSMKRHGFWWSSTENTTKDAYCRDMYYSYTNIDRVSAEKRSGLSVRCIRD